MPVKSALITDAVAIRIDKTIHALFLQTLTLG
jgi:stress-induced morphogen